MEMRNHGRVAGRNIASHTYVRRRAFMTVETIPFSLFIGVGFVVDRLITRISPTNKMLDDSDIGGYLSGDLRC